jgi:NAD(P)-dependent dehydrogenase (short-subunit alcohol dehydrogenase family)
MTNTYPGVTFQLDGKTALITGGASGIGRAVGTVVAEYGANIGLVDLPTADFTSAIATIEAVGGRAIAVPADVTDVDSMTAAVARIEDELGPLTLAVNAAGIANAAPAEEMDLAMWQRLYDVDVTGVFISCQAEARAMLAHGEGSIVNIASMSGSIANRGLTQAHYNSAKAAVIHLSKSLAAEWATRGVRVNALSPGYTMTPMNSRPEVAEQVAVFASETPMQRTAEPEEMAGPAVFLLSPAASFLTGHDLIVDGGFTIW